MKATRMVALVALMVSALAFGVAGAMEHPKKTEHPANAEHPATAEHPAKSGDIVAVAAGAENFKTLVAAVKAAGMVETLQGKGPFTVFAPTDAAFAKLPKGTVENLLKPENKDKLAALLANHVVPGKIMSADIKTMKAANAGGHDLDIKVGDGVVMVNDAKVIKADIAASNGVIHAIDHVLVPAPAAEHSAADKKNEHPTEHPKK